MKDYERLDASAVQEILPLTPLQEGMLLHALKNEGDRHIYWIQMKLEISGPLDVDVCRKAWERVAEENSILKTALRWENIKQPVQVVLKDHPLDFRLHHDGELPRLQSVPFRVVLERTGDETHLMTVICHHILLDGWSTGIMFREFFQVYESLRKNSEPRIGQKLPFGSFIRWSRNQDRSRQDLFWKRYLEGEAEGALLSQLLPGLSPRQMERAARKPKIMDSCPLSPKLNDAIYHCSATMKVPQSAILYAAWGLMLKRYCGLERLVFGTTVSGRPEVLEGVDNTIGMFINTIPLSVHMEDDCTIEDFLRRLAKNERERRDMEATPLTRIAKASGQSLPLFDTAVVLENYPLPKETIPESLPFNVGSFTVDEQTDFNLSLTVSGDSRLQLAIEYSPELFSDATIERMHHHFQAVLAFLTGKANDRLGELDILSPAEKTALLYEFNDTELLQPGYQTVHTWFQEQAFETPDAIAVADSSVQVSYRHLMDESLGVARVLRERGIVAEDIIAIAGFRQAKTASGILGILFAGGAYLPFEPQLPAARINLLLRDSGAGVLLAAGEDPLPEGLEAHELIHIDQIELEKAVSLESQIDEDDETGHKARRACYVMYTSGSTGNPKGVVAEHGGVVNVLCWYGKRYAMGPGVSVLQMTGFSFDPSIEDLFGTILFGGTVWIGPQNLYVDPEGFCDFVTKRRIHLIDFIPAILHELLGDRPKIGCLDIIISGGERLEAGVKDRLLEKGYRLENHYGPTETTVDTLACRCDNEDVNLGGPVANMRCYILDDDSRLAPLGMPGELCVAGMGVARGYLNNPELTAEKFVQDPFQKGVMMYRTGDRARWLERGAVDFIGRADRQIKIRGQRVELGEVEHRIREYPLVSDCVVLHKKGRTGGGRLTAFVIPLQSATIKQKDRLAFDLRISLEQELPEAMIPSSFLAIETIPRTLIGKPDRAALEALNVSNPSLQQSFVAPRTGEEQALAGFWRELLEIDNIGVKDDFFKIGGNSLLLVRLYSMINKQFPNRVSVQDLFDHRTIESLARKLLDNPGDQPNPGKQKSRKIAF